MTPRGRAAADGPVRPPLPRRRAFAALAALLLALALPVTGCVAPQLALLQSGLDSLRTQVDTLQVRDSVSYRLLADVRGELSAQRDILLSTRASSGSTTQELFEQMGRLEGKLDDVMHRFGDWAARTSSSAVAGPALAGAAAGAAAGGAATAAPGPAATGPASPDPTQLYDQATRDLTEGRYPLALQGYRDFLARYPNVELADNAQYGLGECYFAQAAFDSAAPAYELVGQRWPKGDRAAAALYTLGLCQEKLGRAAEARRTFQDLVTRFPGAGEAGLAREHLGASHH